ncbi:hypothetical protein C8R46DRAFT_1221531 [Mycena filopes]|nr:hypothetical protein C8R46DRAFT_1221531 [Mycena filopes]
MSVRRTGDPARQATRPLSSRTVVAPLRPDLAVIPLRDRDGHPDFADRRSALAGIQPGPMSQDQARQGAIPSHSRLLRLSNADPEGSPPSSSQGHEGPAVPAQASSPEHEHIRSPSIGSLHEEEVDSEHRTHFFTALLSCRILHTDEISMEMTLVPVFDNEEFLQLIQGLENDHGIVYQPPKAIICLGLHSADDGPKTIAVVIEEPDRVLVANLIDAVKTKSHRFHRQLSRWTGRQIGVSTSRTPLELGSPRATDPDRGYRRLGWYHEILAAGAVDVEVPPAIPGDEVSALLVSHDMPVNTPCYVLYMFATPLGVAPLIAEPSSGSVTSTSALNVGPHPIPAATTITVPSSSSTLLHRRFPEIFRVHQQLQATQFGKTYKNFHHTRYVYEICEALNMHWPSRGNPVAYIESGVQISVEYIVDWLQGSYSSSSFRNWRAHWVLAQDVLNLLTQANAAGQLTAEEKQDWTRLYALVGAPPCVDTPVPVQYQKLSALTTTKYVTFLTQLQTKYSTQEIINVDDGSNDGDYID